MNPIMAAMFKQPQFHPRANDLWPCRRNLPLEKLRTLDALVHCRRIWLSAGSGRAEAKYLRVLAEGRGLTRKIKFYGNHLDQLVEVGVYLCLFSCQTLLAPPPLQF